MRKGALAAVLVVAVIGVATWARLRPGPEVPPPPPTGTSVASPTAPDDRAAPATSANSPAPGQHVVHGFVTRDGGTVAARVDAFLLDEVPPDSSSEESWDALESGTSSFRGAGSAVRGTSRAGADGKWKVEGLPPGRWLFLAVADDGARGATDAILGPGPTGSEPWPEGPGLEIEVVPAPHSLRGKARLPGGAPFRGLVMAKADWRLLGPPVETGPEGEFSFPALPRTCVRLVACDAGPRVVPGPFVLLPCDEEVPFVVGTGLVDVTGRVLEGSGDRAVAGARVTAEVIDGFATTVSDSAGRYRLAVPERSRFWFQASAPGYLPARAEFFRGTTDGGPPVDIRLSRPARLSGTVRIDGTGAPAAGAVVVVPGREGFDRIPTGRGTCGPDGRYEIPGLVPGRRVVLVAGGGFASKSLAVPEPWDPEADTVDLVEGGEATRDLAVVAAPRVVGRVVDAEGNGVPGVSVAVSAQPEKQWSTDPGDAAAGETFTTASDGRFSVPSLLPGVSYEFLATRDRAPCAFATLRPLEAGREAEVVLRIPPECQVEVRVLEEGTEKPLPGVRLSVMASLLPDAEGKYWGLGEGWTTGVDGSAAVGPVPAVPLLLTAWAGPSRWTRESSEIRVEPPLSSPVVFQLQSPPATTQLSVEGTIVLADGSPAGGAEWTCRGDSVPGDFWKEGNADFRGRFRIEGLQPGGAGISASLPGNVRSLHTDAQAGDRGVVVRFEDAGGFRLVVLDPDGRPVRGGKATLHFPGVEDRSLLSSNQLDVDLVRGTAAVELPRGAKTLFVQVEGAFSADPEPRPLAEASFGPLDAPARKFEAILTAGRVIEGRVVDPEGGAVPGADLGVSTAYGTDSVPPGAGIYRHSAARSDVAGRFRIEGLADREYDLWARAEGGFCGSEDTKARGGDRDVVVVMRRAASATITVLDPAGKPVPGAGVDQTIPHFHFSDRDIPITNASGKVRLDGLDPQGQSTLTILPPEGRTDLLQVKFEEWTPKDTTVSLPPAHVLVVHVKDPKGQPLSSVSVVASFVGRETDPNACSYGTTAEDGTVALKSIPAGPIAVRATLEGCYDGAGPTVEAAVDGGHGRLTLTMDPGAELRVRIPDIPSNKRVYIELGEPGHPDPRHHASCFADEVRIRGLAAGVEYDLFAQEFWKASSVSSVDVPRRSALVRGVRAGGEVTTITLSPGKAITGAVRLPGGWFLRDAGVVVGDATLIGCDTADYKGGTFTIEGVPEGRWTVRVRIHTDDGQERTLDAEADAGGTVELDAR